MTAVDNPSHAFMLHAVTPQMIINRLRGKFPEPDIQSALGMVQQGRGAVFVNRLGGMIILHDRGEDIEGTFHIGPHMMNTHNIELWRQYAAAKGAKTLTGFTKNKTIAAWMQRTGFRLIDTTATGEFELTMVV